MIPHLEMNVTRNLILFPSKRGVPSHYISHIILSHSNLGYNKYLQAEFGAYLQASQVNDPNNTNILRTLDGIYLLPAPNLQGGHQIMYLQMGKYITIPKVFEIPITYVVINNDGEMVG